MSLTFRIMITLSFILTTTLAAAFEQGGEKTHDLSLQVPRSSPAAINYERYLGDGSVLPEPLKHSLQIISDLQKLPSCNGIAASALLDSCATLDGTGDGDLHSVDNQLDDVKSIFATRSAVCELLEAKATIPTDCQLFVPTERSTKKHGFRGFFTKNGPKQARSQYPGYEDITEQHLDRCRRALESRPQWWTSYSNARQGAMGICQSVRASVEQNEQIQLMKVFLGSVANASETIHLSSETLAETERAFHDLVVSMQQVRYDLASAQGDMKDEVQRVWAQFNQELRADLDDLSGSAQETRQTLIEVNSGMKLHKKSLAETTESAQEVGLIVTGTGVQVASISKNLDGMDVQSQYLKEFIQQHIMQELLRAQHGLGEVNALTTEVRQTTLEIYNGTSDAAVIVAAVATKLLSMENQIDHLHRTHEETLLSANSTLQAMHQLQGPLEVLNMFINPASWLRSLPVYLQIVPPFVVSALLGKYLLWLFPGLPKTAYEMLRIISTLLRSYNPLWSFAGLALAAWFVFAGPIASYNRWMNDGLLPWEQAVVAVLSIYIFGGLLHLGFCAARDRVLHHSNGEDMDFEDEEAIGIQAQRRAVVEKMAGLTGH